LRAISHHRIWHLLFQWTGIPEAEAPWEPVDEFGAAHPSFQLEDELSVEGGEML